jgi:cobalamin biosynthesis protein CobT
MPFKKFNEFLNEQKKLKKNKNKSDKKALGDSGDKSLVYKPSINKYEKIKDKDGLGCVGDQKNVYEPKTEPLQSKAPSWNKTNVKEWLNKTKKLPLSEFAKNIYEEKNKNVQVDFNKIKNTEDLIENFVKAIKNNPRLIESAARQLNRSNLTESFLAELIKIENSKKISESISDPVGFEGEEDEDDEDHHHHRRSHKHNRMDDESEEDMSDEEGMDDEESEDVGDEEESDYNDEDSEEEDSDYNDEDEEEEDEDEEDEDLDSDDLGHSENDDMENDMPLGRRRKPHSEDYFSDEA